MGDPARPGPQFLARSAGEGEGGWFPAPQPLIVGLGAPSLGDAVSGVRTKCCRSQVPLNFSACNQHCCTLGYVAAEARPLLWDCEVLVHALA